MEAYTTPAKMPPMGYQDQSAMKAAMPHQIAQPVSERGSELVRGILSELDQFSEIEAAALIHEIRLGFAGKTKEKISATLQEMKRREGDLLEWKDDQNGHCKRLESVIQSVAMTL